MRRMAALLVCVTLVAAACRPEKSPPPAPVTTATTAPPTSTAAPTTTLDVSTPPSTAQLQDPAYWNAVLAALNHVVGDVFRSVVATRTVEAPAVEALHQVYGPTVFPGQHDALTEVSEGKLNGLLNPPGDPVARVTKIVKANSRCVALTVVLDYTRVNASVPTASNVMRLVPQDTGPRSGVNPTHWTIDEFYVIEPPERGDALCVA